MSNSPISSSRIDSKDESWLLLLSDPSAEKAKMRSKLVFFSCCTLMTMIPAIAALVLYPLGQVFAALISLILAGAGLAGGFCLYVNRMLRPTHHIATAIERFRRGDSAVRCPEKAPGLLGLLGERVNLFLSQIQEGRKELMRVAPHIDIIAHNLPGGLLCCAEDFELRFVSDGMLRLLRCSREEITGRYGNNWKNIVHPDDFAFTVAHLDEQRKIQPEYRLSYRIQRADGSSCWVMESSRLTVNADGVPEYVCIIIDDTEQKIIENRRIAVERQYRRALQSVCEMLIQVDLTNDLVLSEYVRWGASSRFPRGENYSQCCVEFMQECVHPDDRGTFSAAFCRKNLHLQNIDEDAPVTYLEYRIKEPSGNYHWVAGTLVPLEDEATHTITAISYVVDIDERRRREDAVIDKSRRDGLTGLLNRNAMFELIASTLEGLGHKGRHSLFMIDLDNFKAINDNFGHVFGDAVLREVADGIRSVFRPTDALARIGGDEFLVFLENVDKPDVLARKAGEVVSTLHKSYIGPGQNFPLSCSVGISVYPDDGRTSSTSLRAPTPPCMPPNSTARTAIPLGSEPRFFALLLPSVCRNARGYSSRSTYSLEKAFPTASGCSKSSLRSLSKSTTREAHTGCCGVLITPSHRCRCWYSLFQLPFSPRVPPHANDKLTAPRSFHRQPRGRPFLRLSERAHILPYESETHLLNRPPGLSRIPL